MMFSKASIDALKALANPIDILVRFGGVSIKDITESQDEIRCPCPIHGGDNSSAFSWKKSTGQWCCFTKNCAEGKHKDVYGFLREKLKISFVESAKLLSELYNYPLEIGVTNVSLDAQKAKGYIKQHFHSKSFHVSRVESLDYLPGYKEEYFEEVINYLNSRGYLYEEISSFNIYPSVDRFGILRMGIPVYDHKNNLVGVNARILDTILDYPEKIQDEEGKEIKIAKYKMSVFKKGSVLYNLNVAKESSVRDGIIIVEGQMDVMRLHTYGIKNVVCTMGTSLTSQQASLLYSHCFKTTFLVEEGKAARKGILTSLGYLTTGMKIYIAELPSGDADSNDKETVTKALNEAKYLPREKLLQELKNHKDGKTTNIFQYS